MTTIGIIDIGSNSIRLVVAEAYENIGFKIVYEVKKSVRLAKDMSDEGQLNESRVNLAIETLKLFKDICKGFRTSHIISVATAAVRVASNQQYFLNRVQEEVGIQIKVLAGIDEAFYDYFGIINSMSITDGIIMDIGGASTELILVSNRRLRESISLPFGAINLSDKFNLGDEPSKINQELIQDFLNKAFNNITWLREVKDLPLIGIGGTIRNIGKIDRKKKDYPLELSHNYTIESKDVIEIYNTVKDMNLKQRKKIKGLSKDRADIFLGAISVVKCLIEYCNCPKLLVSGSGVREGLIYEYLLKNMEPLEDVLEFSLNSLIHIRGLNKQHSEQVWNLSNSLFNQLQPLHSMGTEGANMLKASSFLYNIGVDIDYYNNNEHSFYNILNSKINGLTPKEKLMAAHIVSILKKEGIQSYITQYRSLLLDEEIDTILKLALILKLSVDLNLRKNNNVNKVCLSIMDDTVVIKLICEKNPSIEVETAMNMAPDFQKLFNKRLIIV